MRMIVCLLIALSVGSGAYAAGAIAWAVLEPESAAASLLFTIPIAIVGTVIPALFAVVVMVMRTKRGRRSRQPKPHASSLAPSPQDDLDLDELRFAA
jgi:hypothetical protein